MQKNDPEGVFIIQLYIRSLVLYSNVYQGINLSILMVRNGFSDTKPRIITDTQGPINEIK